MAGLLSIFPGKLTYFWRLILGSNAMNDSVKLWCRKNVSHTQTLTNNWLHSLTGGIKWQCISIHAWGDARPQGSKRGRAGRGGSQTGGDAGRQTQRAAHRQKHQQILKEREHGVDYTGKTGQVTGVRQIHWALSTCLLCAEATSLLRGSKAKLLCFAWNHKHQITDHNWWTGRPGARTTKQGLSSVR